MHPRVRHDRSTTGFSQALEVVFDHGASCGTGGRAGRGEGAFRRRSRVSALSSGSLEAPDVLWPSVALHTAAATAIAVSAGQQQDHEDDEKDGEHGHLPTLS